MLAGPSPQRADDGVCEIFLLTGADNVAAQAFYASVGYAADSERMFVKRL